MSAEHIVLFDGICNLCNGAVRFILVRDPRGRFRFASLQSNVARRLLKGDGPPETIILIDAGKIYSKSTAALRIARGLRFPWPLLYGLVIVPRFLRDVVYDWVARNRYRWFGKRDTCMLPTPQMKERFLD
jgi:predicted DCC family thiol-disulfide oxidoreductase YuxK